MKWNNGYGVDGVSDYSSSRSSNCCGNIKNKEEWRKLMSLRINALLLWLVCVRVCLCVCSFVCIHKYVHCSERTSRKWLQFQWTFVEERRIWEVLEQIQSLFCNMSVDVTVSNIIKWSALSHSLPHLLPPLGLLLTLSFVVATVSALKTYSVYRCSELLLLLFLFNRFIVTLTEHLKGAVNNNSKCNIWHARSFVFVMDKEKHQEVFGR